MPDAVDEIRAALESVVIRSPGELLIDGEVCRVPDPIVLFQMNAAAFGSSPMLSLLQTQVYARLYGRTSQSGVPGEDLTPILSAANRGRDRWEEAVDVILKAFGGQPFSYQGKFFTIPETSDEKRYPCCSESLTMSRTVQAS